MCDNNWYDYETPKKAQITITEKDIKIAIRFSKVYKMINVPLKKKIITADVVQRRAIRASKLWAKMFAYRLG